MQGIMSRIAAIAAKVTVCAAILAAPAQAATITVNSLADDVFPNGAGAIFDAGGSPVVLGAAKCTLRMAIASANLDPLPGSEVGGAAFGCAAGSGADTIVFDAALGLASTPGTITLASKAMSEAPAVYGSPNTAALAVSRPLTITGPGSTQLTIDANVAGNDGRRPLVVSDGVDNTDFLFRMTGVRFYRGRTIDLSSGCMFTGESLELDDVTFENCESVGGATNSGFGGALGAGSVLAATVAPNITIANSKFLGNRAVRGTPPFTGVGPTTDNRRPDNGAAFFGSGTRKVGAVTLTNVLFNGNSAERQGAMVIQNAASVVISGSLFVGNAATGIDPVVNNPSLTGNGSGRYGGFLITNVFGSVTINNGTRVIGNVANEERGGFGVSTVGEDGVSGVTIDSIEVSGNFVNRGRIGGFEVLTDTFTGNNCNGARLRPVVINNVRILGNSVATNTGGFRVTCSGALTMTDSSVRFNRARGFRLVSSDPVASGNSAGQVSLATDATAAQSTATLTRVTIQGNQTQGTANGGGYGVFSVFGLGAFTADSVRVLENSTASGLSGLALNARGAGRQYLVTNSEFAGNTSPGAVALLAETDGNYTLRNSTVSENVATAGGGGTVRLNANTNTPSGINFAIEHSTIARNVGANEEAFGVGVWANQPNPGVVTNTLFDGSNAAITVRNSILGARAPGSTAAANLVGIAPGFGIPNPTATNSLLENSAGAPAGFCGGAGMKCNIGSLVSPLAANGGAAGTRTMALLAGSPAINAGGAVLGGLTTDQRGSGFPRMIGGVVDMGAYETDPATTTGCTLDIDGNLTPDALTDGLMVIRALFGLTGTAVTNNAVGASPTRGTWSLIQSYLNTNCGTNLAP
ncbi:MAG: hypothetical protein IPM02_08600 [Betaproteobacteria bacterium]|nr:hypothetical protein [Betaproteobacteria bacterium]